MRIKVTRTIAWSARPLDLGRARDESLRACSEAFQPVRSVDLAANLATNQYVQSCDRTNV